MLFEKTKVFILENEAPDSINPDVSPYRCSYCGELAIIERQSVPEGMDLEPLAEAVYCDCTDAVKESSLKQEVSSLQNSLSIKTEMLRSHIETKTFDSDTHMMRYEDAVLTLKKQYGITT